MKISDETWQQRVSRIYKTILDGDTNFSPKAAIALRIDEAQFKADEERRTSYERP